jgi:hypothetical protein
MNFVMDVIFIIIIQGERLVVMQEINISVEDLQGDGKKPVMTELSIRIKKG